MPLTYNNKQLLIRLLRELAINTVRSRKDWTIKKDFLTLWWMSAGRYRELALPPWPGIILSHLQVFLPFELTREESQFLVS